MVDNSGLFEMKRSNTNKLGKVISPKELEKGRKLVREARQDKYSRLFKFHKKSKEADLKILRKDLIEEIEFDLDKIREERAELTEIEKIASEVLTKGWSKELEPSKDIYLIEGIDKQSLSIFIESKERSACCAWRKYYVYDLSFFIWEEFVKERKWLVKSVGKLGAIDFYARWLKLLSSKSFECWYCSYILSKLTQQDKNWFSNFNWSRKRKVLSIREKDGLTVKRVADPNMTCCQVRTEDLKQIFSFIETIERTSSTKEEVYKAFVEICEIRDRVKTIFLCYGKLKQAICQDCYEFLEILSVMIKRIVEEEKNCEE